MKRPPIPREHGAWAVLYAPYAMACLILMQFPVQAVLGVVLLSAVFISHEPFAKLLRSRRHGAHPSARRSWQAWLGVYSALALVSLGLLLFVYSRWLLVPMGVGVLLPFALHLWMAGERQDRTVLGETLGIVGLSSTSVVGWYVIDGSIGWGSILLWGLCVLFFMSGVFFVKMRVGRFHKRESFAARRAQNLIYHGALMVILAALNYLGWISTLGLLTFVPIVLRAGYHSIVSEAKLNLRRIGFLEVAYTLAFAISFPLTWVF